ncbi:hypothetical protein B0J12DRAFT_71415 [Macrophomina phaseolina]|uniref:Uncharacterized protein n=1 Tax=Macrophomina phaseolina TaxID=35725 RepID=A0ABQ8GDF3_9PEZI|nr:hypothetical protein B0J12DRAFT_71415 [Macrophomina phaseolina]
MPLLCAFAAANSASATGAVCICAGAFVCMYLHERARPPPSLSALHRLRSNHLCPPLSSFGAFRKPNGAPSPPPFFLLARAMQPKKLGHSARAHARLCRASEERTKWEKGKNLRLQQRNRKSGDSKWAALGRHEAGETDLEENPARAIVGARFSRTESYSCVASPSHRWEYTCGPGGGRLELLLRRSRAWTRRGRGEEVGEELAGTGAGAGADLWCLRRTEGRKFELPVFRIHVFVSRCPLPEQPQLHRGHRDPPLAAPGTNNERG